MFISRCSTCVSTAAVGTVKLSGYGRDFVVVETWERHRLWGIKYHCCLLTNVLQQTESVSLPTYVYLVLVFFRVCLFTIKMVFVPRGTTAKECFLIYYLSSTGVSFIDLFMYRGRHLSLRVPLALR